MNPNEESTKSELAATEQAKGDKAKREEADESTKPNKRKKNNVLFPSSRATEGNTSLITKAMNEAFGPLELDKESTVAEVGKKVHTRNHVNPLSAKWNAPIAAPEWSSVFKNPSLPLFIDIGCAAGRFGLAAAASENWKEFNHLGLEIRELHVNRANAWAAAKKYENLHYITCSANTSLKGFLETYPGTISWVAVQFPDPHFKKKHHKRRVVTPDILDILGKFMPEESVLFLQSDVEETSSQMRDRTAASKYFSRHGDYSDADPLLDPEVNCSGNEALWTGDGKRALEGHSDYGGWLTGPNPVGIPTEREVQNNALGLPIYRATFKRNSQAFE